MRYGLKLEFIGATSLVAENVSPLDQTSPKSLSFIRPGTQLSPNHFERLAGIIFVESLEISVRDFACTRLDLLLVICEYPEAMFFETVQRSLKLKTSSQLSKFWKWLVHRNQSTIENYSNVGCSVSLGMSTKVASNCTLVRAKIGKKCIIQAGVRVGDDALGAVKGPGNIWVDRPHLRGVVIGDNVRIENNTVVQAGFLQDTVISSNCRIGPLTSIGNGVEIGEGTLIGQGVVIAGSVRIGSNCKIWGNASIREGLRIGDGATIGMGSVVTKDVPDGATWMGNPARERQI